MAIDKPAEIVRPNDPRPFTRVGRFRAARRLCAGDLRRLVAALDRLGYPDDAEVDVITPLPPKDRRAVDFNVYDYTPNKLGDEHHG